jgi:acetolactate synthase-1/2/3 large subunit
MDLVGDEHPLYCGRANVFGPRYANMIIQNADLVIAIGARFGIQHTGYNVDAFCRGAHVIMVDIEKAEMQKPGLHIAEKIVADAGEFVNGLWSAAISGPPIVKAEWKSYCVSLRERFAPVPSFAEVENDGYVDPKYFIGRLSKLMPASAVFPFGSSGMGHTVTGGVFECKKGQRVFTFKGLAAMGYGLPSVVGAALAAPGRPAFTLVGEGGLQLNLQELQTAKEFHLPIKVIVFNNGGYYSIHMTQKAYFDGHFVGSGQESGVSFPSLSGLAELYGMDFFTIGSNSEIDATLLQFIESERAAFLEVVIDPTKALEPKVSSMTRPDGTMVSRPLEDMAPLLDRDELGRLMHIPLL